MNPDIGYFNIGWHMNKMDQEDHYLVVLCALNIFIDIHSESSFELEKGEDFFDNFPFLLKQTIIIDSSLEFLVNDPIQQTHYIYSDMFNLGKLISNNKALRYFPIMLDRQLLPILSTIRLKIPLVLKLDGELKKLYTIPVHLNNLRRGNYLFGRD